MTVEVLPVAEHEAHRAARRLEQERRGYGERFANAYDRAIIAIGRTPAMYPAAEDAPAGQEVRYVYLKRYSYRVLYAVLPNVLLVVAVAHTSREPEYWHDRLPSPH